MATVKKVLNSWGPGRFDAELDKDGKAFRPDGGQAGTLIPPAFGLAGVNLHTWTGFGSVPYWNAYVGATEMHGSGTFFDRRLSNPDQYAVSAKSGSGNTRGTPDLITSKLAALHFYQIAIPAPKPPADTFDQGAAVRGKDLFNKRRRRCVTCACRRSYRAGQQLDEPAEIGVGFFSRPTGRRLICIARLRSRDCGRTRRAVSITTAALRRWGTFSSTTTATSSSS